VQSPYPAVLSESRPSGAIRDGRRWRCGKKGRRRRSGSRARPPCCACGERPRPEESSADEHRQSAAYDADNYACETGVCVYQGCNTDGECASSFMDSRYLCH